MEELFLFIKNVILNSLNLLVISNTRLKFLLRFNYSLLFYFKKICYKCSIKIFNKKNKYSTDMSNTFRILLHSLY